MEISLETYLSTKMIHLIEIPSFKSLCKIMITLQVEGDGSLMEEWFISDDV